MENNHDDNVQDCARRITDIERTFYEFREAMASRASARDEESIGLAKLIATETERASGYAYRIEALESRKPVGIQTILITAAAVIGVVMAIGAGFLSLMQQLDEKDMLLVVEKTSSISKDVDRLYVEGRDSRIYGDENRQNIATLDERTKLILNQLDAVDREGSRVWATKGKDNGTSR